jgi:hypothetical protein
MARRSDFRARRARRYTALIDDGRSAVCNARNPLPFGDSLKKPDRSAVARVLSLGKDAAVPGETGLAAKHSPTR